MAKLSEAQLAYARMQYLKHRDTILFRQKNDPLVRARRKAYQQRPEVRARKNARERAAYLINSKIKERNRAYLEKNREKIKQQRRERYAAMTPEEKSISLEKLSRWAKSNPERYKEYQRRQYLKRSYGMTKEEYEEFLDSHGRQCAICKTRDNINLDHCHKSKVRRGILCNRCNQGLGYFRDDPRLLKLAAAYLTW